LKGIASIQFRHRNGADTTEAKDLEAWSLNILDATTLDDVFRD
jgi:hypothetical protein